jgi:hypothetical protein
MDVHAPHEPVHNWRDFLTHLIIVTIGLFIALTLEAGVDSMHHRHLVREARENIRLELQTNHEAAQKDLVSLQQNIDLEKQNILSIQALRTDPKHFHGSVSNTMDFDSLDDAAWRTARDSGALTFMPYGEIQRYSDLYMMQAMVNDHAVQTAESDFLAAAPFEMGVDAGKLPDQDYATMLHENAAVEIRLVTLKQIVEQYDSLCVAELKR